MFIYSITKNTYSVYLVVEPNPPFLHREEDDYPECDGEVPGDCAEQCHLQIMEVRKEPCGKDGDKKGQKKILVNAKI